MNVNTWTTADADGEPIVLEARGGDLECSHSELSYGMTTTKALCVLCGAWIYVVDGESPNE